MSGAATPLRRSTAATDRAAVLAWRSAVATEPALVCTPIASTSWFGVPDTVPVPVTVIRAGPDDAVSVADKANLFLALFRSAESSVGVRGPDADVKSFFESIHVRPEHERAVLDASVSTPFLRKLLAEPASELTTPGSPSPTEKLPAKSR